MDIDPKRTGVKASVIPWAEPPMELKDHRWHGPPGAFIQGAELGPNSWCLCCPGCGELGSPREGAKWTATSGSFEDVTTLTLSPSIQKSCCGWHGYLRGGVFESC
jgi:hypothetical protein